MTSNFTIDHFCDKNIGQEYECPVCFNIMFTICEFDSCGHTFCDSCIKQFLECPVCKNKNIKYHSSKIKCYVEDCDMTFRLAEAKVHLADKHNIHNIHNISDEALWNFISTVFNNYFALSEYFKYCPGLKII